MGTGEDAAWVWAEVEEAAEYISTSAAQMAVRSHRKRCVPGVSREGRGQQLGVSVNLRSNSIEGPVLSIT